MKDIVIENKGSHQYKITSDWTDFSNKELLLVHKILLESRFRAKAKIHLALFCLNLRTRKQILSDAGKNILTLPGEWMHTLLKDPKFLGWLNNPNGLKGYPLKSFWYKGRKYHGPARSILDLKMIELIAAYTRFLKYSNSGNIKMLDGLVALLYRPARPFYFIEKFFPTYNQDKRQKLNPYHLNKRTEHFQKLPLEIKHVVLRQFSSEWKVFQEKHKPVFSSSGVGKYDPDKWVEIMINLSGGAFGTLEQLKMHNADEVFKKIGMDITLGQKIKKNNVSQKPK